VNAVATALYTTLSIVATAQGAAGVYDRDVPDTVPPQGFPRIIFDIENDADTNITPTEDKEVAFSVKAISAIGFLQAGTISEAIRTALHRQTLTVTGWSTYDLKRERATPRIAEPIEGGGNYYHVGSVYRLRLETE